MPHLHANGIDLYYEWHGPETGDVVILNNGIFMSAAEVNTLILGWLVKQP